MKKVILIKGNPVYITDNPDAENFYNVMADYIKKKGFEVELDPGEPHTIPSEDAFAWIAHSRGVDRLRFAPSTIKILDVTLFEHPIAQEAKYIENKKAKELGYSSLSDMPVHLRNTPPKEHYIFTDEMKKAIDELLA